MFKVRLLSGIVLILLAFAFLFLGGLPLLGILVVISTIGYIEYSKVCGIDETALSLFSKIYIIILYIIEYNFNIKFVLPAILLCFLFHIGAFVFSYPRYDLMDVSKSLFGCLYIPTMISFIFLTRMQFHGLFIVWLIFISSWGCDTCAYCVGMLFGKHKMSPVLSPKKSIEGAVGGVVGTVLLTFLFLYIFKDKMNIEMSKIYLLSGLSAVGAFISMVGDLTASAIKRNFGIKDYGNLIPGHGGIMDRFDSVIVTAPIIYYLGLLI